MLLIRYCWVILKCYLQEHCINVVVVGFYLMDLLSSGVSFIIAFVFLVFGGNVAYCTISSSEHILLKLRIWDKSTILAADMMFGLGMCLKELW